jgi:hypothetical protein
LWTVLIFFNFLGLLCLFLPRQNATLFLFCRGKKRRSLGKAGGSASGLCPGGWLRLFLPKQNKMQSFLFCLGKIKCALFLFCRGKIKKQSKKGSA